MSDELRTELVDTHCHLDFPEFDQDRDEVIRRAVKSGIVYMVNIGSSLQGSQKSVALAQRYGNVYASVGIHPHDADSSAEEALDALRELSGKEKVVAIGETGLDYYKNYSKAQNQLRLFNFQAALAKEKGLPLVVHSRAADEDTLKALKSFLPLRAVVHCFSGSEDFLRACLEWGFLISFTCNVTYKKAQDLRELARQVPLERLMLETDAPFLSPEGFRGRRNEPAQVHLLARELARVKEVSVEEIARATTGNAREFFNLK
ncbi:MAG: TatD family hydrolase [Deltaproteobacteria bacterium]